jgi:hypothetical protein
MNGRNEKSFLVVLCLMCIIVFSACQTTSHVITVDTPKTDGIIADIQTAQTDVAKTAQGASDSADVIKETVKEIADTKVITETQIKTLTVYTDKESGQRKILSDKIDEVTGLLNEATKSHIQDNQDNSVKIGTIQTELDKVKVSRDWYKSLSFKLIVICSVLILSIAGYVVLRIKKIIGI